MRFETILTTLSDVVWGPPMLVLLVGTGVFLTLRLRGLQFTTLVPSLRLALIVRDEPGGTGDVSHYQALMTALAATVGTGNIAGVATAIAAGGPGALFWMWMTGLVGMATKFAEAVLAVKYRVTDDRHAMAGGPMYYIERGLGWRWLGIVFAGLTAVVAFGIGNLVQANSVADALRATFGVPLAVSGAIIALATALVVLGGIQSIAKTASVIVPTMIVFYLVGGLIVLAINWRTLPDIALHVFSDAFSPAAAAGGFAGATVTQGIRFGIARGVFSNESGLGSGAIAAAAATVSERRPRSPARDRTIRILQQVGRRQWKKDSGYHQQARVENAFFRYKSIIGESLRARRRAGQETEAILACNILNQMTQLGRPASYAIGR